ncbi:hypothetical protein FACS1894186_0390 [Alphaproteobacteria bacterium]|nr:hypothetical protein FACS1894186_0390 [Alphaproteobacteria bacterium]
MNLAVIALGIAFLGAAGEGSAKAAMVRVQVKKGDSVYALARKHGDDPKEIISRNSLKAPYELAAGQELKINRTASAEAKPAAPAPARRVQTYEVSAGESVYGIARKFEIPAALLLSANKLPADAKLMGGQKLTIPLYAQGAKPAQAQTAAKETAPAEAPAKKKQAVIRVAALPRPDEREGGAFAWPVKGKVIGPFGAVAKGQNNDGINIAAAFGTGVRASENGVVAFAGQIASFGNLVLVKHSDGFITAYGHNDKVLAKKGETVKKGQVIALAGSSGGVDAPQVHFEIRKGTRAVDPLKYLARP